MKKLLILMLFGVLFVPMNGSAKADEVLYCQSELATGLSKEDGTWKTYDFPNERWNQLHLQIIYYARELCQAHTCYGLQCVICKTCFPNRRSKINARKA